VAFITTFSSAVTAVIESDSVRIKAVQSFLKFLTSTEVEDVKRRQGMAWL